LEEAFLERLSLVPACTLLRKRKSRTFPQLHQLACQGWVASQNTAQIPACGLMSGMLEIAQSAGLLASKHYASSSLPRPQNHLVYATADERLSRVGLVYAPSPLVLTLRPVSDNTMAHSR